MKNVLIVFAFLCVSLSVRAQVEAVYNGGADIEAISDEVEEDPSYIADTEELVAIISENAFKPYIDQFASMVAAENQEAFRKDIDATFPELYSEMAKIYMDQFTHDEILELIKFYSTPVGKKMADNSGSLAQKGMVAGQAWGVKVQEIISKYQ